GARGPGGDESGCSAWASAEDGGGAWIRTYEYTEFILQNLSSPDCADLSCRVRKNRIKNSASDQRKVRIIPGTGGVFSSDE
ncbi:hypothetical protein, partial [Burkholderia sp.]|uniref:hypothetical protein n=1 Tax=Burkholderia sp. TaxID=36773 RepID=UPI002583C06E